MTAAVAGADLSALTEEVRQLREQVASLAQQGAYLTEQARAAEMRQREWGDLGRDLAPIANDLYAVAVDQLAELEPHVQLEDLLRLVKRLARSTRALELTLERLDSVNDVVDDAMPLANDVFAQTVEVLGAMERRGWFSAAREMQQLLTEPAKPDSLLGLLRRMSDPDVRRALTMALGAAKIVGQRAAGPSTTPLDTTDTNGAPR
jgi:uncharacterized protein YjgD (DUF1641 family)